MQRPRFSQGSYYYISGEGVGKRTIFSKKEDFCYFVRLLYACNARRPLSTPAILKNSEIFESKRGTPLARIGAYVLLPESFHLIIRKSEDIAGGISSFLSNIRTEYSFYFNKKYKQSECADPFERFFRARKIPYEGLWRAYADIHTSPLALIEPDFKRTGIQDVVRAHAFLAEYPHSSLPEYRGSLARPEKKVLDEEFFSLYPKGISLCEVFDESMAYAIDEISNRPASWIPALPSASRPL
ncbi:hypothetical protein L0Y49_00195 [bacterium]|nr:hypothetical protein [bacterium]